jgi:sugar (pentulose or hexulose) kinase
MGGAVKSAVWLDLLTALIDIPLYKMRIPDSSALGAAFIAACGAGWYGDYGAAAERTVTLERIGKTRFSKDFYGEKFHRYTATLAGMDRRYRKEEAG